MHQNTTDSSNTLLFSNASFIPEICRLIDEGHTATLRLKGVSMRPFLENGRDVALLEKPDELKVGLPVLAFVNGTHWALHRIVAIDGEKITLLGDGNLSVEYCQRKDVKAVATVFYRKGCPLDGKGDSIDGWKWRMYSFIWMHLRPIRRYLLAILRRTVFRGKK